MNQADIQNEFNKGIIMPEPLETPEEIVEDTPEHPNTSVLDNLLEVIDSKSTETNELLENILVELSNESELETAENQLEVTDKLIEEIKSLKEVIKEEKEWEIKLILS